MQNDKSYMNLKNIESIIKDSKTRILLVCAILFIVFLLIALWQGFTESWAKWFDPILALTTLAVALFLWWEEMKENREESLPKRLTASFIYEGKEIMRCERAYLAGESDVRAWGQQLGGQMSGVGFLYFDPLIKQEPGIVVEDPDTGETIKLYEVVFDLRILPELMKGKKVSEDFHSNYKVGKSVLWRRDASTGKFEMAYVPFS